MEPSLATVLSTHLFPLLHLDSLGALSTTCTALRAAVTATGGDVWLQVTRCPLYVATTSSHQSLAAELICGCRNSLPQGHPLCVAGETSSIPVRARQLAELHRGLRSGCVSKTSSFRIQRSGSSSGLTANHQGILVAASAVGARVLSPSTICCIVASTALLDINQMLSTPSLALCYRHSFCVRGRQTPVPA